MGIAKRLWMEQQEQDYLDDKSAWIQRYLGDPDADEFTVGWDELGDKYDQLNSIHDDYDYQDDWTVYGKNRIDVFNENMSASVEILQLPLKESSLKNLLVMLHAHVITSVEAYLSSTFIEKTLSTTMYMRRLVENDPEFAKRKFTIQEIYTKQENLKNDLSRYLKDIIYHDIAKVKLMYKTVFDIDFGDTTWLFSAVSLRHHCVHRAGYDKDGKEVLLTIASINELVDQCQILIHGVESSIMSLPEDDNFIF